MESNKYIDKTADTNNFFIPINEVAKLKGLKSNRSLRIAIQKGKYIAREVKVQGGTSFEILYSSLEPEIQERIFGRAESSVSGRAREIQKPDGAAGRMPESGIQGLVHPNNQREKLEDEGIHQCTALVPYDEKKKYGVVQRSNFISASAKLTALARVDVAQGLINLREKYKTKKEADSIFLDLYNSGMYLPQVYKFLGTISIGTLHRWVQKYEDYGTYQALLPNYKYTEQGEYNTILNDEMKQIFLKFMLHPNRFSLGKAIALTKEILRKRGYENIPCNLTFRRYAEYYKKNNYDKWVILREGEKAYHDKVEAYIERDLSKIEVGDILVTDGHVLNFQIINPFTGKPTRPTLVGFLDWKSGALAGYEIMMTENTQCIASALRNAILNLGLIPKVVYQDNGKAFKSKYFQHCDFDEAGFNGVYANLGIKCIFAKPYNARAKVIERFWREFQEEFEKLMPSYIGTSVEDKPARLKRNEKLHRLIYEKQTQGYIPTVQDTIKYIDCWLDYHNNKPCTNNSQITIKECLNNVQRQQIDKNILNDLMMKTEVRTINRHGITFLNMHYRSEAILGLRDKIFIRYSLFDLSKVYIYSIKGEFLCIAHRVQKVHPAANILGTVKDMEEYKQQYQKQQRQFKKVKKEFLKYFPAENAEVLEIERESESVIQAEEFKEIKQPKTKKLTPREQQMNKPVFTTNYEKYEWLMTNGTTNPEDRKWLANYIRSDEYINIYGGDE